MRRIAIAGVLLVPPLVLACATFFPVAPPVQQRALGPAAPDSAYTCALSLADHLGYTLTASDRASGFFRAEHRYTRTIFPANTFAVRDMLSVAISKQTSGQTEVHVTGMSDSPNREGEFTPDGPSKQVSSDAAAISKECSGAPASGAPA